MTSSPAHPLATVLVVDDEPHLRHAVRLNLEARGYGVLESASGEEALQIVPLQRPDVVLLDLGLPGLDGIAVIRALRNWTSVPVIVLTARGDEHAKVLALDAGADDYVTKPFGIAELLARIRAALRRSGDAAADSPDVVTAHFRLDLTGRRAFVGQASDEVRLTRTEWGIVAYLVRHPNRLLTYREVTGAVWGPDYLPDMSLLRVHMAHIRRKLEPDPARPRYFITDVGMGYRFAPDVPSSASPSTGPPSPPHQ